MTATPSPRNRRNPRRLLKTLSATRLSWSPGTSSGLSLHVQWRAVLLLAVLITLQTQSLCFPQRSPGSLPHSPILPSTVDHLHVLGCASPFRLLPTTTTSSLGPLLADTSKSPNGTSGGWGNGSVGKDACCASRRTRVYIASIHKSLARPSTLVTPVLGAEGERGGHTSRRINDTC